MANTFINIKETFTIADNFASLPSSAQRGALAVTADTGGVYTFNGTTWVLQTGGGGGGVTSVNGQTGVVVLTKNDIGLGQVDNTSDLNKPVSTATQTALNGKENTITAGTISQYYRGDKTFQTLDKAAVGLANVDNTSDLNKPISITTQTALNTKASLTDAFVYALIFG